MPTYYETYRYFYDKTKRHSENFLKRGLILGREQNRSYNFSYNKALKKLGDFHLAIEAFLKSDFPSTYSTFNSRAHFYVQDQTPSVLNNETKTQFENEYKTSKLKNYSYLKCIADLAQLSALKDTEASFRNNILLYELMYLLNKWEHFTLAYYKIDPETGKLYDKLYLEYYGKEKMIAIPSIGDSIQTTEENNEKPVSNIETELSIFDREDKILLLCICFECLDKVAAKMPLTEFVKIITITRDIYDHAIFTMEPSRVSLYKQLHGGLTDYKDRIAQMKKLNQLIDKVDRFKMSVAKNLLISQRNKLSKRNNPKYS